MYHAEENGKHFLIGHLAKANDHVQSLGRKSTVVFHGPHAYVSSKWYETVNVVPTWNYVAVHVSGILSPVGGQELSRILGLMVLRHEVDVASFRSGMEEEVRANLEKHIVGVKMEIEKMEGKWKLSQNKSPDIQGKIVERLRETGDWNAERVAELMEARIRKSLGNG